MSKKKHSGGRSYFMKIGAAILALLMVGGVLFSALYSVIISANAADYDSYAFFSDQTDELYVAIGLWYDEDVPVAYETMAPDGFIVGSALIDDNRAFTPLWEITTPTVSVACDYNLTKSFDEYSRAYDGDAVTVGSYNVSYSLSIASESDVKALLADFNEALSLTEYYAFPAYVNGEYRIKIGQFATNELAKAAIDPILSALNAEIETPETTDVPETTSAPDTTSAPETTAFPDTTKLPETTFAPDTTVSPETEKPRKSLNISKDQLFVAAPSENGVSIINPKNNTILFEYLCSGRYYLGLTPVQKRETTSYTKVPTGYIYSGVICYGRYRIGSIDGVTVINLLPFDEYIEGVLPWEISASWPVEVQKAFAITVRSYAMANIHKHFDKNGFDICCETHCQAYRGRSRVNDKVTEAVRGTKDMVLTYNGKIISSVYTSTAGGASVRSSQAWGYGDYGYLVSQPTPWERYSEAQYSIWSMEVSPEDLYNYLRNTQGYTALTSPISKIEINQFSDNTDYVYSLSIYDSSGHSITLKNTDTVRGKLTKYVRSANFVVGKGSIERTYRNVVRVSVTDNNVATPPNPSQAFPTYQFPMKGLYVINGKNETVKSEELISNIITSGEPGTASEAVVITSGGYAGKGDTIESYTVNHYTFITEFETVTETLYASNPNNFIFAGKGWGHGVGLSQSGAKDLADLGVPGTDILQIYYPGTAVINYKNLH